ncbi:LlaJI family restriction endonuclease [Weissella paramesenteroides]|uniref:LlaJI family restriction endonuclease n=1 Tax=Weissella paramesenteroides TaxID=1249 RepID=UPI0023F6DB0B|nr:LlaJI family restriction endonuclease [Weissella paramesenteroides]MDF8372582.1 LlaJI family restriction endonuclease [Weissella paramesenteroides]WIG66358.1 LlaJI family restriction endonuclease [Weissella paramesenteroides]
MTKISQNIWIDGQPIQKGIVVPKYMQQYFKKNSDGSEDILDYVGFHLRNDELNVMLPKNSEWTEHVSLDVISILIDSLRDNRAYKSGFDNTEVNISTSDLFVVVEWLIQDFRSNGILEVDHTQWNKNRGKIHWGRTIKKTTPFVQNDNLVLLNLIKRKHVSEFDIVSKIHASVMEQIAERFGLLFHGFSFKSRLTHVNLNDISKLKRILNKTYTNTNVRREKMLIRSLLTYLNLIYTNQSELSIVTTEFHVLFENSFKQFIGDQKELHNPEAIPDALWSIELPGQNPILAKNRQIPDSLVVRIEQQQQYLDIYDTKYYDLSYYKNIQHANMHANALADWYSVGKQFFYEYSYNRQAISDNIEQGKNYFVFPWPIGSLKTLQAGHVDIKVGNGQKQRILLLLVDPIELLRTT